MNLKSRHFLYATQEDIDNPLELSKNPNNIKVVNLGDSFFYPPKHLQEGLESVLVFSENTKKRDIPSGSVWRYSDADYKPEILRDDVGCGITLYLMQKGVTPEDVLKVGSQYSFGGGNHFLNKGSFDEKLDYLMLHSDLNSQKKIPKSTSEAQSQVSTATSKRRELIEKMINELETRADFFMDWPHNHIDTSGEKTIYMKGVVDTKKTEGIGLLALTPHDGCALYVQGSEVLNGYMQHGIGVKNHEYLKEYSSVNNSKHRYYIPKDDPLVRESFNSMRAFGKKFYPRATFVERYLSPEITIRSR